MTHVWRCPLCRCFILCQSCYAADRAQTHAQSMHSGTSGVTFFKKPVRYYSDSGTSFDYLRDASGFNDMWLRACELFGSQPCIGRLTDTAAPSSSSIEWFTFAQVRARIQSTAARLLELTSSRVTQHTPRSHLLCPCHTATLALIAHNSMEWIIVYLACLLLHIVVVPLDPDWSDTKVQDAIQSIGPSVCVMSAARRARMSSVVAVDLHELTAAGDKHVSIETARRAPLASCVVAVSCTSGTTGSTPKGVTLTDGLMREKYGHPLALAEHDMVTVVFQPLSSSTGLGQCLRAFCVGGAVGIISSPAALLDELPLMRPSILAAPPSVWNLVRAEYESVLSRLQRARAPSGGVDHGSCEQEALALIRCRLGGNISWASIGGAKTDAAVIDFLRACFGSGQVGEGYGTSEAGPIATNGRVLPGVEVELIDVPELGFFTTDRPLPRGELCVSTMTMSPGYWQLSTSDQSADQDTEQQFVTIRGTRFYRTGDIVELQRSAGRLWGQPDMVRVLDRNKHFFKTASGKFVSPESIEASLEGACASWLRAIYVADTTPLVAVVWPVAGDESLLSSAVALQWLHDAARSLHMTPDEILHGVAVLEPSERAAAVWFTTTGKKQRNLLRREYSARVRARLDHVENKLTPQFKSEDGELGVFVYQLQRLLPGQLPCDWQDMSFDALGGSSLHAMQLVQAMHVALPDMTHPSAPELLRAPTLADVMSLYYRSQRHAPTSAPQIDWRDEMYGRVRDLAELKSSTTDQAFSSASALAGETILLTGATGLVGRFVLDELRRQYPTRPVICLVRAASDAEARARLSVVLANDQLRPLDQNIDVLACNDLALVRLGLSSDTYARLVRQVSHVIHCAARVHFLLPYRSLCRANVDATVELIRLCKAGPLKHMVFVSTASTSTVHHPSDVSASGYVQTKLVSEIHLRYCLPHSSTVVWPVNIIGHSVTGRGIAADGDHLTTVWRVLAEQCVRPRVASTLAKRRLIAVDHVAQSVVSCLQTSRINPTDAVDVTPGPIVEACLYDMLPDTCRVIEYQEWIDMLKQAQLDAAAPLARHADMLLAMDIDTKDAPAPLPSSAVCAGHGVPDPQQVWFHACLSYLMRR